MTEVIKLKKLKEASTQLMKLQEKAQSEVQKRQEAAVQMKWMAELENTNLQETLNLT